MSALALFCLAAVPFLAYRDLVVPEIRAVEVWLGFELHGTAALASAPLHWAIFLLGAWGFWRQRPWIVPAAAGYAFYVALGHFVWSITSPRGYGAFAGGAMAAAFSLPGFVLLAVERTRRRAAAGGP